MANIIKEAIPFTKLQEEEYVELFKQIMFYHEQIEQRDILLDKQNKLIDYYQESRGVYKTNPDTQNDLKDNLVEVGHQSDG